MHSIKSGLTTQIDPDRGCRAIARRAKKNTRSTHCLHGQLGVYGTAKIVFRSPCPHALMLCL